MITTAAVAWLCLAPAAATTAPATRPAARSDAQMIRERLVASRVSRPEALATVRELVALGPRMGGTASGDAAASWVAARMKGLGLRVEVLDDPPKPTHEELSWDVALEGRSLASAWPQGFSPSLPDSRVRLVLADDVTRLPGEIAGAALMTASPPGDWLEEAARRGALAALTDHPHDPGRYVEWAPIRELAHPPGSPAPLPVFALSYKDGQRLRAALAAGADEPDRDLPHVSLRLASRIARGRPRTVVGSLAGDGARARDILIVCAHGDSDAGGPGADDNASGVASLLEVARALAAAASSGLLPEDRPEVRFIVWGAELHSSRAYVEERLAEMERVRAVLNYDETGRGARRDAVYFEGNDIPFNEGLLRALLSAAEDHAGEEGFPTSWTTNPALGGTDAYVFLPRGHRGSGIAGARIPSTTVFAAAWDEPTVLAQTPGWSTPGWKEEGDLFVDYSEFYHSSGDTPANTTEVEPWNMERCARVVVVALLRLMAQAAPPAEGR